MLLLPFSCRIIYDNVAKSCQIQNWCTWSTDVFPSDHGLSIFFMARKYYYQISKTKFENKLGRPPTLKCTTATATMKSYRTHIGGIEFFTQVQFLNQSTITILHDFLNLHFILCCSKWRPRSCAWFKPPWFKLPLVQYNLSAWWQIFWNWNQSQGGSKKSCGVVINNLMDSINFHCRLQ